MTATTDTHTGHLVVRPITATIGAEVEGVSLRDVTAEQVDAIRTALDEHLVLFFRDQHLTAPEQIAFGRHFGALSVAPFGPKHPDHPEMTVLDQQTPKGEGADNWHADNTFMPEPPMGSILQSVLLPEQGGDTCWASMYAAHDALSPALQSLLDGMTARHDLTRMLTKAINQGRASQGLQAMQDAFPPFSHPVVRTNPVTGRKALFVNGNWTTWLNELTERENEVLLPFLIDHVRSPDFQVRFRWTQGAIAFWDNRWVQHYAVPDYTSRRIMQRVTIEGDRPV